MGRYSALSVKLISHNAGVFDVLNVKQQIWSRDLRPRVTTVQAAMSIFAKTVMNKSINALVSTLVPLKGTA